ncbi:NACHT, LRR and PYD domains-containing protein [Acrasis kona]|uniref:NACHT, LRR and PYD domains-containing protein n=1 Tax=Acrasis kona TaxID=1008807 RepID=A0AAW2ZDE5_9EUKA
MHKAAFFFTLIFCLTLFTRQEEVQVSSTPVIHNELNVINDLEHEKVTIEQIISTFVDRALEKSDLFIRNIPISTVEDAKIVSSAAAKIKDITRVVFSKNGEQTEESEQDSHVLKDDVVQELAKGLSQSPNLRVLAFTKNRFESAKSCASIADLLSRSDSKIEKFYLYRNNITDSSCLQKLAEPFKAEQPESVNVTNKLFKVVILENQIKQEEMKHLISLIESSKLNITELVLRNAGLNSGTAALLSKSLSSEKNKLTRLDVGENVDLGLEGFKTLCQAISSSNRVTHLDISNANLESVDAVKTLSSLITNTKTLVRVDLSDNKIGDQGLSILLDTLKNKPSLTKIDISGAGLTDLGVTSLVDAVENKTIALTKINLYRQDVSDDKLQVRVVNNDMVIKSEYFEENDDDNYDDDEDDDEYGDDDEDDEDDEEEDDVDEERPKNNKETVRDEL